MLEAVLGESDKLKDSEGKKRARQLLSLTIEQSHSLAAVAKLMFEAGTAETQELGDGCTLQSLCDYFLELGGRPAWGQLCDLWQVCARTFSTNCQPVSQWSLAQSASTIVPQN